MRPSLLCRRFACLALCAIGLAAGGAVVYQLPEAVALDGSHSGPSMNGDLIPEYPSGLSITAWVKPTGHSHATHHEIFRLEAGNSRVLFSFQDKFTHLSFGAGDSYAELEVNVDAADFEDGRWHYVCAIYGRGMRSVWIDGVKRVEASFGTLHVGRGKTGYVGSSGGTGEFFEGGIADLQIHDVELSKRDLERAYVAGLALRGAEYVWNGTSGADWGTAANWTVNDAVAAKAPDAVDVVKMSAPAGAALSSDVVAGLLRLDGTGAIGVSGAGVLEVLDCEMASGVVLDIPSGTEVRVRHLARGAETVFSGIYTGSGSLGTQVPWLSGGGILRVAKERTGTYPTEVPVAGGDGWYTFGLASGYTMSEMAGLKSGNRQYIRGERVVFDTLALPSNANVRLRGGVAADTIPCDVIGQLDVSGLKKLMIQNAPPPFADGSPFTLPSGCNMYYTPGELEFHTASNCWFYSSVLQQTWDWPIAVSGTWNFNGNGNCYNPRTVNGAVSGAGTLHFSNFCNAARLRGAFSFSGTLTAFQEGCSCWIDTAHVSGEIQSMSLSRASYNGGMSANYSANGLLFGCNGSDETADNPLKIKSASGNAWEVVAANGHRWRQGGHIIVWGGNTVKIGTLENGMHVVANRADQDCRANFYATSYTSKGVGNLEVETFKSGTLYLSTNINARIGSVTAGASCVIDYTYQSNAVNGCTLDFSGTCSDCNVKAFDLPMLPARLSGYQGAVTLTDTAEKTYPVEIDFGKGLGGLYNIGGCIGSGTLAAAPAAGTIDVQIDASRAAPVPAKGAYSIARFTSGGDRLAGWTVLFNGAPADGMVVRGMSVDLKRDSTGLWLDVHKSGLGIIIR